jgi:hypothetical protein
MDLLTQWDQLSVSAQRALRWAAAVAALRAGSPPGPDGPPAAPADLLIGLLLAHPDRDGEAWVLLDHFDLTLRDVLPPGYPSLSAAELERRAGEVSPSIRPIVAPEVEAVFSRLTPPAQGSVQLYQVLGALLDAQLDSGLATALSAAGESLTAVAASYERWAQTDPASEGVAGRSLRTWLVENHRRQPVNVPGYASDGVDASSDLVGITVEADAFAYLLASRDLQPPLAVGLFGNWGSGKSFLMHAVRHRIETLRDLVAASDQDKAPIWKQIRHIEFNAWEYVEGDLWAGLLAHIFRKLGSVAERSNLLTTAREPLREAAGRDRRLASEVGGQVAALEKDEARQALRCRRRGGRHWRPGRVRRAGPGSSLMRRDRRRCVTRSARSGGSGARTSSVGKARTSWTR